MIKSKSINSALSKKLPRRVLKLIVASRKFWNRVLKTIDRNRKTPVYLALLLGGFALIGAALLASSHKATSEVIKLRLKEDLTASLAMVIPKRLYDNDLVTDSYGFMLQAGDERIIYPAYQQGRLSALAYQVTGQGYGGTILILLGIDSDGRLLGVRVLQHAETPGLGDKIEANRDKWILGFDGLSLGDPPPEQWTVKKDGGQFDQFSGATITPRAVVLAVRKGLEFFEQHKGRILNNSKGAGL